MRLGMTGPGLILLGIVAVVSVVSAHAEQATFYGSPGYYDGRTMSCGGTYWSGDPTIIAVGYSRDAEYPCGTAVLIEGPAGSIVAVVQDRCPGCGHNTFDLSDSANAAACGIPAHTCVVSVSRP